MNNTSIRIEFTIPETVVVITKTLKDAGFEAYLVGGCVRDLFLNKKPKDWDITTNARPETVVNLFPHTFYENEFGTVGVVTEGVDDVTLETVEVTTYRSEAEYSNNRHPDSVTFSETLQDDLKRRDFTFNALAYDVENKFVFDYYNGIADLREGLVRTVGEPHERFTEDALRIMRAIRLAVEHNFTIESETEREIQNVAQNLDSIAVERIRDEFSRILLSQNPMYGIELLAKVSVLERFLPELLEAKGVEQGGIHTYDVWEHLLRSLQHSADKGWELHIRLSALFHDIAKPETRRKGAGDKKWTFFGHEVVGARKAKKILERLKYPKHIIQKVTTLVRWHMFFSDTDQITLSAVRRMIANVGKENIWDLMNVRICDRIGTGRPKEDPYRLRKYHAMIEEALRDPLTVGMLAIDGNRLIELTQSKPGSHIGLILHALLEEVLDDPKRNTSDYLENRAIELYSLPEKELKELGTKGKERQKIEDSAETKKILQKYSVKK
ncbi:MAG: CCA tRNA nucleotidyltransferase [Candidatus Paceibacterota bacterium]